VRFVTRIRGEIITAVPCCTVYWHHVQSSAHPCQQFLQVYQQPSVQVFGHASTISRLYVFSRGYLEFGRSHPCNLERDVSETTCYARIWLKCHRILGLQEHFTMRRTHPAWYREWAKQSRITCYVSSGTLNNTHHWTNHNYHHHNEVHTHSISTYLVRQIPV